MNERIDELIEECTSVNDDLVYDGRDSYMKTTEYFDKEKFAELIVRECMKVVIDGQYSDTECEGNSHRISYNNGRYGASSDIKKHFGVEE